MYMYIYDCRYTILYVYKLSKHNIFVVFKHSVCDTCYNSPKMLVCLFENKTKLTKFNLSAICHG